jgi:tetratricopeptide (TPR) repeat protein
MRAALAWSADMLREDEVVAFRRLAPCVGWDLDAACAVVGVLDSLEMVDLLSQLVDKSLIEVVRRPGLPTRYRMLEPVRELARERMAAAGEEAEVRARHAGHFLELAEAGERGLLGERTESWLARLEDEFANLTFAFDWFLGSPDGLHSALRLAGALWRFGRLCDLAPQTYELAHRALQQVDPADTSWARARALFASAALHHYSPTANTESARAFEQAAQLFGMSGDLQGEARALNGAGISWSSEFKSERARSYFQRAAALYREIGDVRGLSTVLHNTARDAWLGRDLETALHHMREALELCRGFEREEAVAHVTMGLLETRLDRYEEARSSLKQGAPQIRRDGVRHTHGVTALLAIAELAEREGRDESAARFFGAAEGLLTILGESLANDDYQWHEHDRSVERLRERLGSERMESLRAAGRALTPEQAMEESDEAIA